MNDAHFTQLLRGLVERSHAGIVWVDSTALFGHMPCHGREHHVEFETPKDTLVSFDPAHSYVLCVHDPRCRAECDAVVYHHTRNAKRLREAVTFIERATGRVLGVEENNP